MPEAKEWKGKTERQLKAEGFAATKKKFIDKPKIIDAEFPPERGPASGTRGAPEESRAAGGEPRRRRRASPQEESRAAGGEPRRRRRAAPPSTPARDAAPGALGSPSESPRDPRPTRADPRPTRARRHNSRLHGKHLKRLNKHRMRTVNTPSPCDGYPDIYCCDPHLPRWNFGDTYDRHMVKKWDVEWGGRRHYAANDCFERPNVKRASMVI